MSNHYHVVREVELGKSGSFDEVNERWCHKFKGHVLIQRNWDGEQKWKAEYNALIFVGWARLMCPRDRVVKS